MLPQLKPLPAHFQLHYHSRALLIILKQQKPKLQEQEPHKYCNKEKSGQTFICIPKSGTPAQVPARTRNTTHVLLLAGKQSTSEKISENTYRTLPKGKICVAICGWLCAQK